jgi:hypothetical protein
MIIARFERDGHVIRAIEIDNDVLFERIKPWSFEWLKFKLNKWRFFL